MKRVALGAFLALSLLAALLSCTRHEERLYKKSAALMYTRVSITVVENSAERAEAAIDAAFEEIRRLEDLLSFWIPHSEIAAINRNAGLEPVKVSAQTLDVVRESLFISEKTGGAFDPTIGPVIRLWDFKKRVMPEKEVLREALGRVGYGEMRLDPGASTAFLARKGMSFDTGGIAKGYAADRAVGVLKSAGIGSGLVAVAGDIRAFGERPGGRPWRVGIRDPRAKDEDGYLMATIELRDAAVSTSGDYERYFVKEGVRYHHLLDPGTGYPARGCRSVTVVADKAVYTDGFSTGVFVLGPERGLRLLEESGMEGIIVDSEGELHVTQGLRDRIKWTAGRQDAVAGD